MCCAVRACKALLFCRVRSHDFLLYNMRRAVGGKIGSCDYVRALNSQDLLQSIVAVVNIDAICFKGTRDIVINASGEETHIQYELDLQESTEKRFYGPKQQECQRVDAASGL